MVECTRGPHGVMGNKKRLKSLTSSQTRVDDVGTGQRHKVSVEMGTLASPQTTLGCFLYLQIHVVTMIAGWTTVQVCENGKTITCLRDFHPISTGVDPRCQGDDVNRQNATSLLRRVNRRCFNRKSCQLRPVDVMGETQLCAQHCIDIEMMCVKSTAVRSTGAMVSVKSGFFHSSNYSSSDPSPGGSMYTMQLDERVAANVTVFLYDLSPRSTIQFCPLVGSGPSAACQHLAGDRLTLENARTVNIYVSGDNGADGTWFLLEFHVGGGARTGNPSNQDRMEPKVTGLADVGLLSPDGTTSGHQDNQDRTEPYITGLKDIVTGTVEDERRPNGTVGVENKTRNNEILYGAVIGGTLLLALIIITMTTLCVRRHRNMKSGPRENESAANFDTPSRGIPGILLQQSDLQGKRDRDHDNHDRYITTAPDGVNLDQPVDLINHEDRSRDVGRYFQMDLNHEYENISPNRGQHTNDTTPNEKCLRNGTRPQFTERSDRFPHLETNGEVVLFENDLYNREVSPDHAELPCPDRPRKGSSHQNEPGITLHENDLYHDETIRPTIESPSYYDNVSGKRREQLDDSGHTLRGKSSRHSAGVFIVENSGYALPVGL